MRAMASNDPTEIPSDELEAAKAGEHWGPQRMTHGRRDVITAFIRRPSDASLLFVKRSEKVNTYKLHWGGVSGVVEGNEKEQNERLVYLFSFQIFSPRCPY
jgi:hypothetical protein